MYSCLYTYNNNFQLEWLSTMLKCVKLIYNQELLCKPLVCCNTLQISKLSQLAGLLSRYTVTTRLHSIMYHVMSGQEICIKARSEVDSLWWLVMSQSSYKSYLHTSLLEMKWSLSLIHQEKQRRQWWSANVTRTFKQSVFNEIHTMNILKMGLTAPCFQYIN